MFVYGPHCYPSGSDSETDYDDDSETAILVNTDNHIILIFVSAQVQIFKNINFFQRRREECERKARRGEMDPRLEFTFQILIEATGLPRQEIMDHVFEGDMVSRTVDTLFHFL